MSVLSKVVIGGIAFVAGALVAAKEDDDKPKHGCYKHHHHQQPTIYPNQPIQQQPYSQPANGWQVPPIPPTQPIPIQVDNGKGQKVDIGNLNVYGGDKLFNDALFNLPQYKDLPLLPNQIKRLLSNVYVRKAILMLLERNGIDTRGFRFDEDPDQGIDQPKQSAAPSQPSTESCASVKVAAFPEELIPRDICINAMSQPHTESGQQSMGVDQATSTDADTVERRAHSAIRVSGESGGLRVIPNGIQDMWFNPNGSSRKE